MTISDQRPGVTWRGEPWKPVNDPAILLPPTHAATPKNLLLAADATVLELWNCVRNKLTKIWAWLLSKKNFLPLLTALPTWSVDHDPTLHWNVPV
jgi:hypothetical protein